MVRLYRNSWISLLIILLISPHLLSRAQDEPIFNMIPTEGTTTVIVSGDIFELSVDFYLEGVTNSGSSDGAVTCDLWWSGHEDANEDTWGATLMPDVAPAPDGESERHSLSVDTSDMEHGRYGFTSRCTYDGTTYWYGEYHAIADGELLIESSLAPVTNILRMRPEAGSVNVRPPEDSEFLKVSVDFYMVGVTDVEGQAVGVTCEVWTDLSDGVADDNWGAIPMIYTKDAIAGLLDHYEVEIDISNLAEDDYGLTTHCTYNEQVFWFNTENPNAGGDAILLISSLDPETAQEQYRRPLEGIDWVGDLLPRGGVAHIYNVGDEERLDYSIQVYEESVTEAEGQGEDIECFLSWGLFDATPTEIPMSYKGDNVNNDEYTVTIDISGLAAGNYAVDAYCSLVGSNEIRWRVDNLDTQPVNEGVGIISILPPSTRSSGNVFVHLFEWKWVDVAAECPFLEEAGYSAVQVSPPQEHVVLDTVDTDPWWTRYQPVSYQLESRSGTAAEFAAMVAACNEVGVGIYVDAVINHMSGQNSPTKPGTAGTVYRHHFYPDVYDEDNFNYCGGDISNYRRRIEVQTCELVNLADLATGTEAVRDKIRDYLQGLIDMGVAGFRIDAAKHTPASDITAILDGLEGDFYIFQEVIGSFGEPILPQEYVINGDVTEFAYSRLLGEGFNCGRIDTLARINRGLLRSDDAVVFVDNHDNQRGHGAGGRCVLDHTDGYDIYNLGNIFMLAYPYGYPKVMSSYWWDDGTAGADSNPAPTTPVYENGEPVGCNDTDWVCEHRRPEIIVMVEFRAVTSGEPLVDWETINSQQIAFGRGDKGFVAINNVDKALENHTFQTSMPTGEYCDVITGGLSEDGASCVGLTITVDENGQIDGITVPARGAFAIHSEARLN